MDITAISIQNMLKPLIAIVLSFSLKPFIVAASRNAVYTAQLSSRVPVRLLLDLSVQLPDHFFRVSPSLRAFRCFKRATSASFSAVPVSVTRFDTGAVPHRSVPFGAHSVTMGCRAFFALPIRLRPRSDISLPTPVPGNDGSLVLTHKLNFRPIPALRPLPFLPCSE